MGLDVYLNQRGLTLDMIERVLELEGDDVAYVSGSVTDGLGDAQSDLDLFVLVSAGRFERRRPLFSKEREVEQRRLGFGIQYVDVAGTSFDVEYHLRERFDELLDALTEVEPTDRESLWRTFRSLRHFERGEVVDRLHRFRIAVPVGNVDAFARLRARFDERRFLVWSAHFHLIECEDYAKGTLRSLRGGDPENAYLKLMRLYDALADATIFLSGDSLDRWKWRLPKLRRLAAPDFLERYLDVQLLRRGSESLAGFVESLLVEGVERREALSRKLKEA